jgi:hypothetical protein
LKAEKIRKKYKPSLHNKNKKKKKEESVGTKSINKKE